ncbi:serine/threonine-protein kinase [Steroidobacter sp.]|uniref:serine/threonine-protein kinase n=1 Tax=Steroidobacter sp. TaxID=1978227 RepID=UPI001A5E3A35|nr:serine/threonine-protein kinase [Steroidobacter sp.]MBL8268180.1 serine/threonine protein kinase [Steroidobacter sp.]
MADNEGEVLRWLEQALDQPGNTRYQWLGRQQLPEWLHQRVERLLDADAQLDSQFLEPAGTSPEHVSVPLIGERLGNYELLRRLDAGGMGVVFLARRADDTFEQQVAIKVIRPPHLEMSPEFRRRLIERVENERALLARLDHRNVARILDGGSTASGMPYLVMEYIQGRSLLEYCDSNHLDVPARVAVFRKVCEGVQEAHRHLIVHRDLKPENILVGADSEPRLLDFGIARTLEESDLDFGGATHLTAMTPAYASPEQVRRQPLTTSSDVYSLGVVLYQLLSGVRPYDLAELTPTQVEQVVCHGTHEPLRRSLQRARLSDSDRDTRAAQLSTDLDRIVAKAMHREPERRYASARELADDLQRYLERRPVLAHPDSMFYRARKFIGRHRIGTAAATLAGIAIFTATGVALWQAGEARRAADDTRLVNQFLLDVLQMSDPFDAGSELTLSQALDSAATSIDERFADRPDLTAEIRFGIGYSMLSRYRLASAEQQLTLALTESQAEFGANDIRTLRVLDGVAGLRQEQGRVDEAQSMYEQVIATMETTQQTGDPLYVTLLGNLANLHLIQERYPEAERWLVRAQAALDKRGGQLSLDRANIYNNLAHATHGLEDYERAEKYYAQAQVMYEQLFPDGNPDLASLLNNRALLAEDRGRPDEALALHRRSLEVRQRVFGSEHPMVVVALANVARNSTKLDPSLSLTMAQDAAAMADRVYTEPASRHASVYATLAEARLATNDLDGAANALQHARTLLDKVTDPPPSVARYLERVRVALCQQHTAARICH